MRLSLQSLTPLLKSMPSVTIRVVEEVVVAAVVVVVTAGIVAETVVEVSPVVAAATSRPTTVAAAMVVTTVRGSKEPSIQTCLPEPGQGAVCISAGGAVLISVVNHPRVLGKTSTLPNLKNETVASSARILQ